MVEVNTLRKYVFVDSKNAIIGVCTADRELTADEVYPGKNYLAIEVEQGDIINNFSMYQFDGSNFTLKPIPEPQPDVNPSIEDRIRAVEELGNFLLGLEGF